MRNIHEISKKLARNYMKKGYESLANAQEVAPTNDAGRTSYPHDKALVDQRKRMKGLNMAASKMAGKAKVKLSEGIEDLQELSKDLISNYRRKANGQAATKQHELSVRGNRDESRDARKDSLVLGRRQKGLKLADKKLGLKPAGQRPDKMFTKSDNEVGEVGQPWKSLKEETDLHEISKNLMGRYLSKAKGDLAADSRMAGMNSMAFIHSKSKFGDVPYKEAADKLTKKADKRSKGIGMVATKLMREDEEINELKNSTLGSYIKKAAGQVSMAGFRSGQASVTKTLTRNPAEARTAMKSRQENDTKDFKRQKGIMTATQKLVDGKHDKLNEISTGKLGSYFSKSEHDFHQADKKWPNETDADKDRKRKRKVGMALAARKLIKRDAKLTETTGKTYGLITRASNGDDSAYEEMKKRRMWLSKEQEAQRKAANLGGEKYKGQDNPNHKIEDR